jgi:hypothetical protein
VRLSGAVFHALPASLRLGVGHEGACRHAEALGVQLHMGGSMGHEGQALRKKLPYLVDRKP